MAEKKVKNQQYEDLAKKTSLAAYGVGNELEDDDEVIDKLVSDTISQTAKKYGERANGEVVNYFNDLGFGKAFANIFDKDKEKIDLKNNKNNNFKSGSFKRYMENTDIADINGLLLAETTRQTLFQNYNSIFLHIPECAQALEVYKDNILSPDDFSKRIFNFEYDTKEEDRKAIIEGRLLDLCTKYELEDLTEEIIEETLKYGEEYVSVVSIDSEMEKMLGEKEIVLSESTIQLLDVNYKSNILNENDFSLSEEERSSFMSLFEEYDIELSNTEKSLENTIAKILNENVKIGSSKELLLERALYEADSRKDFGTGLDIFASKSKKAKKSTKEDTKPLGINGSSIKVLDPARVVELKVDNIVYGYYYAEDVGNSIPFSKHLGKTTARETTPTVDLAPNNTLAGSTKTVYSPAAKTDGAGELTQEKLNLISKVFINGLAKKLNKDFIRHNKEFKDFIFNLLRDKYIIEKGVKLTYFFPEEVVPFKVPAVYRKILFFSKLYLSTLTNDILIKLGRSHDKRVFYVNIGLDEDYEFAVNKVIQDIKTKEYKIDDLNDINTILQISPGRFDDYIMPSYNGDRPVEIETLAGMDADLNNDFLAYLRTSIISGTGVPPALIDAMSEIDFARSLSAQNSNFVRTVIKYQKKFAQGFTKLLQKVFKNEFLFDGDTDGSEFKNARIEDIKVSFPSPASLNFSNLSDQITAVDANAEFIATQLVPANIVGADESKKAKLKSMIVKDMLPNVDWETYEAYAKDVLAEEVKEEIKNSIENPAGADDFGDGMGSY